MSTQVMSQTTENHSPDFHIRHGSADDAEFFLAVEEQTTWESLPHDKRDLPRETLRERLLETHGLLLSCAGNVFFIAEIGDQRAGLLWFGPRHNAITGEHEGWIYNVTVLEAYRGLGIAKKMLLHAEDYAREQGYEIIGLSVAVHNEIARELYRRCEYSESNILMRKVLDVKII